MTIEQILASPIAMLALIVVLVCVAILAYHATEE